MSRSTRFMPRLTILILGLVLGSFQPGAVVSAWADPVKAPSAASPGKAGTPAPDAEGFVPDSRPATMSQVDESIPAAPLVATAYGFIWLAVLGFVLFTLHRTRKLEQELADLESRIRSASPQGSQST